MAAARRGKRGRFVPIIDGYIYEVEPGGEAYLVSKEKRDHFVRRILTLLPLAMVAAICLAVGIALMISTYVLSLDRLFPALIVTGLMAIGLCYLAMRWVLETPTRALANQQVLSRQEVHALRERFEATLPDVEG